jgi:DNA-binding NtrC family response regulator
MSWEGGARLRLLVVDDRRDVIDAVHLGLADEGFDIRSATSPAAVLAAVEAEELDAVLMDLDQARATTSSKEGADLLGRVRELDRELPVVVMAAGGTAAGALEAMRRGARDYLQRPWDNARLVTTLRAQAELCRALRRSRRLEAETARQRRRDLPVLVAESRAMQAVLRLLERVAPSDANVLITGPQGTGKEVAARWIHAASPRAGRSFVPALAGGLPEEVFERELYGQVRGRSTDAGGDRLGCFELAGGGTLFLDEIASMSVSQQARLLRVLQTGEFQPVGSSRVRRCEVRVVSATNTDLARQVADERFREDLLYRLNTVEIALPPLYERREDILPLAHLFLRQQAARRGGVPLELSAEAARALQEHTWPGNVRELAHAIERALLLGSEGQRIAVEDLALKRPQARAGGGGEQQDRRRSKR